jgi:hypothetical protein
MATSSRETAPWRENTERMSGIEESACASTSTSVCDGTAPHSRRSSCDERRSQTPTGDAGSTYTGGVSTAEAAVAECNAVWKKRRRETALHGGQEDPGASAFWALLLPSALCPPSCTHTRT